jgi:hypothetical protein
MSDFIHAREHLKKGDVVRVDCDTQCNVILLSDSEFHKYKNKNSFQCIGGHFMAFPAIIPVPSLGYWNIVIDLGGKSATIRHKITIIRAQ